MRDDWFIRGDVPMTKAEVRAVSLSALELYKGAVLFDIGAGTGSVSVEALYCHPLRRVYAFEKKPEAVALLKRNREKAGLSESCLTIVEGEAPETFSYVKERPTHAFIGGSSGSMGRIVNELLALNPELRAVINVIALETLAETLHVLKVREIEAEIVSVQVARAKAAGSYHLMQGQNPVYVISFGGKYGEENTASHFCRA